MKKEGKLSEATLVNIVLHAAKGYEMASTDRERARYLAMLQMFARYLLVDERKDDSKWQN